MQIRFLKNFVREHYRLFIAVFVLAALVSVSLLRPFGVPRAEAWLLDYKFRKTISFDRALVPGVVTQTNFPVLVSFTDPDLKLDSDCATIDGPCNANGWDIVFTDTSDATLPYEIESYTSDATNGTIVMWVRVNPLNGALAGTDTSIYMYYGKTGATDTTNKTAVWDSNFQGVWHMNNQSAGPSAFMDSVTAPLNGSGVGGGPAVLPAGQVNSAFTFDGIDDRVDVADSVKWNGTAATWSAWVRPTVSDTNQRAWIMKGSWTADWSYVLQWTPTFGNIRVFITDSVGESGNNYGDTTTANILVNEWAYITAVFNGAGAANADRLLIYKNGVPLSVTYSGIISAGLADSSAPLRFGELVGLARFFQGGIDEIHISNSVRSNNWITTEYNNQANQGFGAGKFIKTLGAAEQSNPPPSVPSLTDTPAFGSFYSRVTTPILGNFSSTDTDPIEYEIQWDDNVECTSPIATRLIPGTFLSGVPVSYQVVAGDLLANGSTYWWCVHARNTGGPWSAFSPPRSITINTSLPADAWYQTTSDQFTTTLVPLPERDTLTDTEAAPPGGVKLKGW